MASWLEGGVHPKHRITKYHQFFLGQVNREDEILDIGCGIGLLAHSLAPSVKKIVGVDFSEPRINYARRHFKRDNLVFILGDATTHPFDQKFSKIILSNVLEHIDDRVNLLVRLKFLSDEILIRVPMEDRDWLTVYKKELGCEYRLDSTHRIEYRLDTFQSEAESAGWRLDYYQVNWGELWGVLKPQYHGHAND
jgi:SAM-dependent methyltransferase